MLWLILKKILIPLSRYFYEKSLIKREIEILGYGKKEKSDKAGKKTKKR